MEEKSEESLRTWKIWAIFPSVFLCMILGFLGSFILKFAYQDIRAVESEDISFISLKIVLAFSFVFGYFSRKILEGVYELSIEIALLVLLIYEIYVVSKFSSGILQVDYIFYTSLFQFFAFVNLFTSGFFIANLRKVRLWAFLLGGIIVFLYLNFQNKLDINIIQYLIPALTIQVIELALSSSLFKTNRNQFVYTGKPVQVNDIFFYSSITLFIAHCFLYYYQVEDGPDALVVGGGIGLILFNILYYFKISQKYMKYSFLIGRLVLLLNLVLTMQQAYLEFFYYLLFFMDLAVIAFFRPTRLRRGYFALALVAGAAIAYFSYELHLKYSRKEILNAYLLVIVNLVWLPLIFKNRLGILNKLFILSLSFGLTLYFYSPLPFQYGNLKLSSFEKISPIPFELTGLDLNDREYIFYNTTLPFENSKVLPKRKDFKSKIVVLGLLEKPELILTYIKYLDKNNFPYVIFQNKSDQLLSPDGLKFTYMEYPLFRIYYPESGIKGKTINNPKKNNLPWDKEFVESKFKNLSSNDEIADALNSLIQYSGYELGKVAKEYKEPFFLSYKKYAEFHYNKGNYNTSISMTNLALKFKSDDAELMKIAYKSILSTTPETSHISIMNKLLSYNEFKEMILKRLYPILMANSDYAEAMYRIEELISFYTSSKDEADNQKNIETLKVDKVKILIQTKKVFEAEDIIRKELAKSPDSPIWQKLNEDLKYIKDTTYRPFYFYATNTQKDKENSGEENKQ
jgi:hypothetical protein